MAATMGRENIFCGNFCVTVFLSILVKALVACILAKIESKVYVTKDKQGKKTRNKINHRIFIISDLNVESM